MRELREEVCEAKEEEQKNKDIPEGGGSGSEA